MIKAHQRKAAKTDTTQPRNGTPAKGNVQGERSVPDSRNANEPVAWAVMYPNGEFVFDYVKVEIDEPVLKRIARETGGKYFRATDRKSLGKIYSEIDKMEKTKFEEHLYTKRSEWFFPLAGFALFLLLLEPLIKRFWIKTLVS